ncbi:MAG: hypothetical protein JSW50_16250 [Candidatus Latescibacterota bacterium]|nr:MAG: hypothetical protein JSW50_16250 [Candidatus Latescibacterota bacterium]
MLRVGKILVLSLLVTSLCVSMAFATTSRVIALGGSARYINDDSDIFRWYGTLPSYSKMVFVEAGTAFGSSGVAGATDLDVSYQALGLTHNWGEDHWLGTWAIYLVQDSREDPSFYLFNPLGTPGMFNAGLALPSTKFAIAWGKQLNSIALGIEFTRSDGSIEVTGAPKINYNFATLGGGVRWDINEDTYGDAAVTIGWGGGDLYQIDTGAGTIVAGNGWDKKTSYDLEARVFWEFLDDVTLVPYFGYSALDFSEKLPLDATADPDASSWGDKASMVALGAAFNFDVNTNNLLIFAMEFENWSWEYSKKASGDNSELKATVLPRFTLALESDITSWFTARVGATKTMTKYKDTAEDGTEVTITEEEWAQYILSLAGFDTDPVMDDFQWYLGGGFHVGEWDIDAVFSHEVPFRLGYWLTGYGTGNPEPPVGRVSATYRF